MRSRLLAPDMMVVELLVDVKDAMGANAVNTICEGVSHYIQQIIDQGQVGVRILSNLCTERMTKTSFKIPIESLAWKDASGKEVSGKEVAVKILETYRFADLD